MDDQTFEDMQEVQTSTPKKLRGFAAMKDKERMLAICSAGGKAAHAKGTAHEFTREEAIAAGRKGGVAAQAKRIADRKFNYGE